MNHIRSIGIGTVFMFALISPAQQSAAGSADNDKQMQGQRSAQESAPSVEEHLRVMTEKLGLSADQQAKVRPIIQQMFDTRQKLMQDSSLSDEARGEKERVARDKADKKARKFLNDEQKKKLDQIEAQPHA